VLADPEFWTHELDLKAMLANPRAVLAIPQIEGRLMNLRAMLVGFALRRLKRIDQAKTINSARR